MTRQKEGAVVVVVGRKRRHANTLLRLRRKGHAWTTLEQDCGWWTREQLECKQHSQAIAPSLQLAHLTNHLQHMIHNTTQHNIVIDAKPYTILHLKAFIYVDL